MNILHISSNYPPEVGGPAASVPYLAKEQSKSGHNVYVLTHGTPEYAEDDGIKVYRSGSIKGDIRSITSGLKKSIAMSRLARKIITDHKIDIIHSHDPNVSSITKILADPKNRIPSVVKYSGDLAWETIGLKSEKHIKDPDKFWQTPQAKAILRAEKIIFSRFDRIIAQNTYQKTMLKDKVKIPENKIEIIPNAVKKYTYTKEETESVKKDLPTGTKIRICTVARLVPWKGIDTMIRAMKETDPNTSYIIIGDGPEKHNLKKLAESEKVSDRIFFLGKKDHDKVQLYIGSCDVLIVPSLYEPFGITILDGFASEVPVIGRNIGGIPDLLENDCMFKEKSDIGNKIKYCIENRKKIIELEKDKLEKYTWSKISKKTEKLYRSIPIQKKR